MPDFSVTSIEGSLDPITGLEAVGWAWNRSSPEQRLQVEILDGANVIAIGTADGMRPELLQSGFGDGRYGFRLELPESLCDGLAHEIHVRCMGEEMTELRGALQTVRFETLSSPSSEGGRSSQAHSDAGADWGTVASPLIIHGALDIIYDLKVCGWAWNPAAPEERIQIEILDETNVVASGSADVPRPDLAKAGIGDGKHGFCIALPDSLCDGLEHEIHARTKGENQIVLPGSSKIVRLETLPPMSSEPETPSTGTLEASGEKSTAVAGTTFDGALDLVSSSEAVGWALDLNMPKRRLAIEILDGAKVVATGTADLVRLDLLEAGTGDGRCGFRISLPESLCDGEEHEIHARVAGANMSLRGSPQSVEFEASALHGLLVALGGTGTGMTEQEWGEEELLAADVSLTKKRKARSPAHARTVFGRMSQHCSDPRYRVFFDLDWYLDQHPYVKLAIEHREVKDAFKYYLTHGISQHHSPGPLFDAPSYYQLTRRLGYAVKGDPLVHYLTEGEKLGLSPHWLFDEPFYRFQNPDVAKLIDEERVTSGYIHYLTTAGREERRPHPLFSESIYQPESDSRQPESDSRQPESDSRTFSHPFLHFLTVGQYAQAKASGLFDWEWYEAAYSEVAPRCGRGKTLQSTLHHFLAHGILEGRTPVPDFDADFYLKRYEDVRDAVTNGHFKSAVEHWLRFGVSQSYDPNRFFNGRYYLDKNPAAEEEIREWNLLGAFEHFMLVGKARGLRVHPPMVSLHVDEDAGKILFARRARILADNIKSAGPLSLDPCSEPEVSFVIPVFNEFSYTMQVLAEIQSKCPVPYEAIVVDNASSDDTRNLERYVRHAVILRQESNLGFPAACNIGWRAARGRAVVFMNNDIEIGFGAVEYALETLFSDTDIGAVGGRIIRTHGLLQEAGSVVWRNGSTVGYGRDRDPSESVFAWKRDVDFCSACFLMVKREALEKIGGYDEAFSPGYYEEVDLCARLWGVGYRVVYDPRVYIYHFEYASFSKGRPPAASHAIIAAHRKQFVDKHEAFLQDRPVPSPDRLFLVADRASVKRKRVLMIEDLVPLMRLGSGFGRANQIVNEMRSLGYEVTLFIKSNHIIPEVEEMRLELPGVELIFMEQGWGDLDKFLASREDDYDVIWVCRTHNAAPVRNAIKHLLSKRYPPRLVLDTEAVASMRDYALSRVVGNSWWTEEKLLAEVRNELLPGVSYDLILAVNAAEQELIRRVLPGKEVAALGFRMDTGHVRDDDGEDEWRRRKGFLFVGAVHDIRSPNFDSLVWFIRSIWPSIRAQMPTAIFDVVGYWKRSLLKRGMEIVRGEGINFVGAVDDLAPYFESARVFVAPTRYAAGIPFKVHEAIANGLPAVVTPLLARQMGWKQEEGILYPWEESSSVQEFAENCVRLHEDSGLWTRTRSAGLRAIRRDSDPAVFAKTVEDALSWK